MRGRRGRRSFRGRGRRRRSSMKVRRRRRGGVTPMRIGFRM